MRHCYRAGMLQSSAAIFFFCCVGGVAPVSCFAPSGGLPHVGNAAASFGLSTTRGESRWASSMSGPRRCRRTLLCSISRDDAIDGFDPMGFSSDDSAGSAQGLLRVPGLQGGRGGRGRGAAKHALHARKSSTADEAQATRRRGAAKGSLHAITIGMSEVGDVHANTPVKEEAQARGAAKGWDYWKYRALLLGVALLWGTNFPAVSGVYLVDWYSRSSLCARIVSCALWQG